MGSSAAFSQAPKGDFPLPAPFEELEFVDFNNAMLERLNHLYREYPQGKTFFEGLHGSLVKKGYHFLLFERNPSILPVRLQKRILSEDPLQPALTLSLNKSVVISIKKVVEAAEKDDISPEEMLDRLLINESVHIIQGENLGLDPDDRIPVLREIARTRNAKDPIVYTVWLQVVDQLLSHLVEDTLFGFVECENSDVPGILARTDFQPGSVYFEHYYIEQRDFFIRDTFFHFFGIPLDKEALLDHLGREDYAEFIYKLFHTGFTFFGRIENTLQDYLQLYGLLRETRETPLRLEDCQPR